MRLFDAILVYLVVLIISFILLLYTVRLKWMSSLALSLLLAQFTLISLFPVARVIREKCVSPPLITYIAIPIVTFVLLVLYVLLMSLRDFQCRC